MNKAVIIAITSIWLIALTYTTLAKFYQYPYRQYAVVAAWGSAALLFVCILIYIYKHRSARS